MQARTLSFSTLGLIAGCGCTPAAVGSSEPGPTVGATSTRPTSAWVKDSPFAGEAPPEGAVDSVVLPDGTFVVAQSYASEAEPFVLLTGKKGALSKSKAPWTCAGGPAEIDVSGTSLWGHCMGLEAAPRIHFWHSADLGKTWTPVGVLDGAVALGSYALAGDTLFVTGKFAGQTARLHVFSRESTGKFSRRSAKETLGWPDDMQTAVAAAPDGRTIALLGLAKSGEVWIAASTDGGSTLRSLWRGAPTATSPMFGASIEDEVLTFLVQQDSGPSGVGKIALAEGKTPNVSVSHFPSEAEDACVYGSHVAVQLKGGTWAMSSDAGASFVNVPAPRAEELAALECSASGARYGSQVLAW
ncbi:hypothetical protein [Polyangium sp. y55x31]|uniref:hypothetical protein n=1 Tax=Polyangium sp. y55x31 TaxID=3042688 RepID=UPI0024832A2D|nr:hypothetical protein [Polyangium sp. y55x31]MDI1477160.1 hypothetical protein [Polyangium sp. y55x31]